MSRRGCRTLIPAAGIWILLGGCAGSSQNQTLSNFWTSTQETVTSAYEKTKETVSSTFDRITGNKTKTQAPPEKETTSAPARLEPSQETVLKDKRIRQIQEPQVRDAGGSALHIIPRQSLTSEGIGQQLAQVEQDLKRETDPVRAQTLRERQRRLRAALQSAQEEESIVREMDELRGKIRLLQDKLDNIRRKRLAGTP